MYSFHPDKYGSPSAKGKNQDEWKTQLSADSLPPHYPTWNLKPQKPAQDSWAASSSVVAPSKEPHARSPSRSSITIPGFNKNAYGLPRAPAISSRTNRKPSTGVSASHINSVPQPPIVEEQAKHASAWQAEQAEQAPWAFEDPQVTNGWDQSEFSRTDLKPKHIAPFPQHIPDDQPLTRHEPATSKDKAPATYATLKKEGETPEQVIKRLQGAGLREAHVRMRRRAQEGDVNTGLATLDFLRRPITPDVTDNSILPAQTPPPQPQIAPEQGKSLDPPQSIQGREQPKQGATEWLGKEKIGRPILAAGQKTSPNTQAEDTTSSHLATADGSGVPINSASTKGAAGSQQAIRNSSDDQVDSAKTNTAVTSQPSPPEISPPQATITRNRGKWVTNAETKPPPPPKTDSNAEGTDVTDSSTRPLGLQEAEYGKLLRSRGTIVVESALWGWDGKMQPPPIDWEHRGQFYNNTPEYIHGFEGWLGNNTVRTMQNVARSSEVPPQEQSTSEIDFGVLPADQVQDVNNHADGIGFVPRDTVITLENAAHYGRQPGSEILEVSNMAPPDFDVEVKVDERDGETLKYRDETAQLLIDRRMTYLARQQKEAEAQRKLQETSMAETEAPVIPEPPQPKQLKTNIYLRPAVSADYPGMTRIYNWHIKNGVRPSELVEISEVDMETRHTMSTSARLPFIVAVERNRKNSRHKPVSSRVNPNHPIQNTDPNYNAVVKDENIVGWASATDWSACDYVETTTAELEIYVAHDFRQKGVGRCLMDALLDATDRGHNSKGGYDFHVAREIKHLYNCGGGRDLHKIIFQVRSYNKPVTPEQKYKIERSIEASRREWGIAKGDFYGRSNGLYAARKPASPREEKKDFSKAARLDDREDEYDIWLKEWLESVGFEEEAFIKKIGTKGRRYVDVRYLTKETAFQPQENRIPDFSNGI
ncbi:hypothetical protein LTR20_001946 [Exophiala xenobiotica]|nr:hypothetical protein LTS13_004356 [Exophiala xenobiotica]KAK5393495.1 hypothetical protein LTR79_009163 [Exophiala xenobiotica]KAK5420534.1 hypothetical protein LTR90_003427 [Exophiala xenobiotica]KAK5469436.1 hypothetical protein LTR20_001946 [Exophiala xenobiotica]KAK5476505.1 hypothetical protein LTR26_008924 [Exophiala xenobiotica]